METATTTRSTLLKSLLTIEKLEEQLASSESRRSEPVAVVGMACRFPGAHGPDAFWRLLLDGRDATGPVPPGRWDPDRLGPGVPRRGGFLDAVDRFDAAHFGVSPREARAVDPQHRLLLELSWEALEHAGIVPASLARTRTGVWAGVMTGDYARLQQARLGRRAYDAYSGTGMGPSFAAGRVSYALGLRGPSMVVSTACSSSLVTVHLAAAALRSGEADVALAGGVNVMAWPDVPVMLSRLGALSPDGRCKTFSSLADGYGRGEGCGVVVLKRLSDAVSAGDRVWAVVRGSAVNHDGPSGGLTVPSGPAQRDLIRDAIAAAGVSAHDVGYVEAHGTGTPLGDPIEINALHEALCQDRPVDQPLLVGAAKANVGHLEAAAGIAGLIKAALVLHHGVVPPHPPLGPPNPHLDWDALPVSVPDAATPWPEGRPRVAGVSSFGMSGINAHVVLAAAPDGDGAPDGGAAPRSAASVPSAPVLVSARTPGALGRLAGATAAALRAADDPAAVAASAHADRTRFPWRLGAWDDPADPALDDAATALAEDGAAVEGPGWVAGRVLSVAPPVAWLFSGQGAQYAGMGAELFAADPAFRARVAALAAGFEAERAAHPGAYAVDGVPGGWPLLAVLYPGLQGRTFPDGVAVPDAGLTPERAPAVLAETAYTQPALFVTGVALAERWAAAGVVPSVVVGHSVGELAAAVATGRLGLADGLALACARGRAMQAGPAGGAMAAVYAGADAAAEAIAEAGAEAVSVASDNGPSRSVVSGPSEAVAEVEAALAARGVRTRRLAVSHAFHSDATTTAAEALAGGVAVSTAVTTAVAGGPEWSAPAPRARVVSAVTGAEADGSWATPAYWSEQVLAPVRYGPALAAVVEGGATVLVEVGPGSTLVGLGRLAAEEGGLGEPAGGLTWVRGLREGAEAVSWGEGVCRAHVAGVEVVAGGVWPGAGRAPWAAATYPFEPERHWVAERAGRPDADGDPLIGRRIDSPALAGTLYESSFDVDAFPALDDHQILGTTVVPAALQVLAGFEAGRDALGADQVTLHDVEIMEAMELDEGGLEIHIGLGEGTSRRAFQIASRSPGASGEWRVHTAGIIGTPEPGAGTESISEIRERCATSVSTGSLYETWWAAGLELGSRFRPLGAAWRRPNEALAELNAPASDRADDRAGLLDALFQICGVAWRVPDADAPLGAVYVPVGLDRLTFAAPLAGAAYAHAQLEAAPATDGTAPGHPEELGARAQLLGDGGEVVAVAEGIRLRRVDPAALVGGHADTTLDPSDPDGWTYERAWEEAAPADGRRAPTPPAGRWVVVGRSAVAEAVVAALTAGGANVTAVDIAEAPEAVAASEDTPLVGVLHVGGLDPSLTEASDILRADGGDGALQHGIQSVLGVARTLVERADGARLHVITRGAQVVSDEAGTAGQMCGSMSWGLGRAMSAEHPARWGGAVDLDPDANEAPSDEAEAILEAVAAQDGEDEVAYRSGRRYVARLRPLILPPDAALPGAAPPETVSLHIEEKGVLEGLRMAPKPLPPLAPDEVRLRVRSTGLNFRDVLNALDMYPGDPGPLGLECAGVVSEVGAEVDRVAVGDPVVGIVPGCFSTYGTTKASLLSRLPQGTDFADAATVPVTFLTAYAALREIAALGPDDTVLVHAASGGVGSAAIQIARGVGARIIGTTSEAKRPYVRSLGVDHIFDSRSLSFVDDIRALTGGGGVDVVLNSLSDEFIPETLALVKDGGTFVEIGKRGVWAPDRVAEQFPTVRYTLFDLVEMTEVEPDHVGAMLDRVVALLDEGTLTPLPRHDFALDEVVDAFRFMSQAKHQGKIVVSQPDPIRPDATYVVTGGTGALGRTFARALARRGARHVALVSRSGLPDRDPLPDELAVLGATVHDVRADAADFDALAHALAEALDGAPPVAGAVHAAGVLDDGALASQTWDRVAGVLGPKAGGAWALHRLERALCGPDGGWDWLVLCSSAASVVGTAGQAGYAAANAFLDGLAGWRRSRGLAGVSVNWGPWSGGGMAAGLEGSWSRAGVRAIDPSSGASVLGRVVGPGAPAQVAVLPVDWARFAETRERVPALLRDLIDASAVGDEAGRTLSRPPSGLLSALKAAPPDSRRSVLREFVRAETAKILSVSETAVDDRTPFRDAGFDSLMSVELRNALKAATGLELPTTLLYDHPTVDALVTSLEAELAAGLVADRGSTEGGHDEGYEVLALDDDEAERLLREELDGLELD